MSLANALINFNNKSDAVHNIRDRSLFIPWGGGERADDFRGGSLDFLGEQKGGTVVT